MVGIVVSSGDAKNGRFNTLAIDQLEDATTAIILVLMFIGGGSLSTASGIKVVTFIVLVLATYSYLRRDEATYAFQREIPKETISKALALTLISVGGDLVCHIHAVTDRESVYVRHYVRSGLGTGYGWVIARLNGQFVRTG